MTRKPFGIFKPETDFNSGIEHLQSLTAAVESYLHRSLPTSNGKPWPAEAIPGVEVADLALMLGEALSRICREHKAVMASINKLGK